MFAQKLVGDMDGWETERTRTLLIYWAQIGGLAVRVYDTFAFIYYSLVIKETYYGR